MNIRIGLLALLLTTGTLFRSENALAIRYDVASICVRTEGPLQIPGYPGATGSDENAPCKGIWVETDDLYVEGYFGRMHSMIRYNDCPWCIVVDELDTFIWFMYYRPLAITFGLGSAVRTHRVFG
jgi:hypothetical protein